MSKENHNSDPAKQRWYNPYDWLQNHNHTPNALQVVKGSSLPFIKKKWCDEVSDPVSCSSSQMNNFKWNYQTSSTEPDTKLWKGSEMCETQNTCAKKQVTRKCRFRWKYGKLRKSRSRGQISIRKRNPQLCEIKTLVKREYEIKTSVKREYKNETSDKREYENETSDEEELKAPKRYRLGYKSRNMEKSMKIAGSSMKCTNYTIGKPFVQNLSCANKEMKFPKCRECLKDSLNEGVEVGTNSFCRFIGYRKLIASKNGNCLVAGFLKPSDATHDDMLLWLANSIEPPKDLTISTSQTLLIHVGNQFCDLVKREKAALLRHIGSDKNITWKKHAPGVREMCDVCDTTLFNVHWVCPKCGFAVCIDCYEIRKQESIVKCDSSHRQDRDDYLWLFCNNGKSHFQKQLLLTQMIPGDALWILNDIMHKVQARHDISCCKCTQSNNVTPRKSKEVICKALMNYVSKSFEVNTNLPQSSNGLGILDHEPSNFCAKLLYTSNMMDLFFEEKVRKASSVDSGIGKEINCLHYESFDYIQRFINRTSSVVNSFEEHQPISDIIKTISAVSEDKHISQAEKTFCLSDYVHGRYPQPSNSQESLPLHIFTSTESNLLYKDAPHSWLCHGRLLLLHDPNHLGNLALFQDQWKRGQPVMVMGVNSKLDALLWHPDSFCAEFGHLKSDLVDCQTGAIIPNMPMRKFWLGFENLDHRVKNKSREPMILKLKDWPPGEDFSEKLPKQFQDLMNGLPLPEYTHRNGIFNLAGRLPSWLVRPDLGPKMYTAYGSALCPTKGTTNLHLDVSDAVNVMVYVGIPHDDRGEDHVVQALKAFDEGGCDSLTKGRIRSRGVKAGALWHIYDPRSADKIRDFLTKVAIERGEKLETHHDPIHDQSWYLDFELRKRFHREYGIQGYAIAQCLGDAVFIPAGAPHQVQNLHSCVKIAEDFVSPENITHCFKLTEEFRHLSDTHTNHEDKLQIKNIICHVVKDALSHLI